MRRLTASIPSVVGMIDQMTKEKGSIRHHHQARLWPKQPDRAEFERASAMFRALGDSARLQLITRLSSGEACVTELADVEGEKLTTVSARLKTLHDVRLVKRRREAKHMYYSLSDTHVLRLVESALEHAAERRKPPVSREPEPPVYHEPRTKKGKRQ
jgi:ArsR family transcriptional regulator, lead/cadmium/zinc/bismuth-responsive transcriptional repressor